MISISCPYFKDSFSSIFFGYSGLICTISGHLFLVNYIIKTMMLKKMSSNTNMYNFSTFDRKAIKNTIGSI